MRIPDNRVRGYQLTGAFEVGVVEWASVRLVAGSRSIYRSHSARNNIYGWLRVWHYAVNHYVPRVVWRAAGRWAANISVWRAATRHYRRGWTTVYPPVDS